MPGWRTWVGLLALALSGCAQRAPLLDQLAPGWAGRGPIELVTTPIFPQQVYQCGPAALATLLNASGMPVQPDELVDQVYLPQRRGSVQPEMVAAVRRHGRIPYRLRPGLDALLEELDVGRPVLVLQNLGLDWLPQWHYAVVIGLDPARETVILRSGTRPREMLSLRRFLNGWRRAGEWALVVLRADQLPADDDSGAYLRQLAAAEETLAPGLAAQAYAAALRRWPQASAARFGLAHSLARQALHAQAAVHYRRLLHDAGPDPVLLNNLAEVEAARGCRAAAQAAIRQALRLAADDPGLGTRLRETARSVQALASAAQTCPRGHPGCGLPCPGDGDPDPGDRTLVPVGE